MLMCLVHLHAAAASQRGTAQKKWKKNGEKKLETPLQPQRHIVQPDCQVNSHAVCTRVHRRFIGYHLLVFALNNSMGATAAHIGAVLRVLQQHAGAAAAAAAAAGTATASNLAPISCGTSSSSAAESAEITAADNRSSAEYSPSSKAGPCAAAAAFTGGSSSSSKASAGKAVPAAAAASGGQPGTGHEQSPMHIVRAALQVMAMLLLMYLLIDVTAAIVKGKAPAQELLRSLTQIKALLQLMLAPLSMMLVGLLLAVFQFRGPGPEDVQQQGGARAQGAAAGSKKGLASGADSEPAACPY
jgi:hypothetical protein